MVFKMRIKSIFLSFIILFLFCAPVFSQTTGTEAATTVRIGYFSDNTFHVGQSDSQRKSGYGYEYYQELSKYTEWKYEYVYGTWNEVYMKFVRGEIDIIDAVSKTPAREKLMLFSDIPMGTENFYIFTLEKNTDISDYDITTLNGKKIGVNANSMNSIFLEKFLKENNLDAEIVFCTGYDQRMYYLRNGKIDAMVTTDSLSTESVRAVCKIGSEDFYFAVNPARTDLLEELNLAQAKLLRRNPVFEINLRDKYFKNVVVQNYLNEEEKLWLQKNPVLKIGYQVDTMPFCTQDKDGNLTGLLKDILLQMEKNLGIEFETIPYASNNTMAMGLREGKINLSFPVPDDSWYSEKRGYIQTSRVVENRMTLVYSGNYKSEMSNIRLGYVTGSPEQEMFLGIYSLQSNSTPFESIEDLFHAIEKGQIDCAILNSDSAGYVLRNNSEFEKLKMANLDEYVGFCFGLALGNPTLYSIIELAIMQLNEGDVINSLNRYSHEAEELTLENIWRKYKPTITAVISIILAFILLIVIIYNHFLSREKNRVIAAREKASKADADARTDPLTGAWNRRAFFEVLDEFNKSGKQFVVAFLDIDDFKEFNNKYGHETGDQVLRFVVKCLKDTYPGAFIGRFGGDEFVVVFEDSLEKAEENATLFIARITDGLVLRESGTRVPVGSSIGLAAVHEKVSDIRDILNKADIAMYKAKRAGKNQFYSVK